MGIAASSPTDVVKTRAQLSSGRTAGVFSALAASVRAEGWGVYRGIGPMCVSDAPKRALKFSANAAVAERLAEMGLAAPNARWVPRFFFFFFFFFFFLFFSLDELRSRHSKALTFIIYLFI
jgi:hypothetical protein